MQLAAASIVAVAAAFAVASLVACPGGTPAPEGPPAPSADAAAGAPPATMPSAELDASGASSAPDAGAEPVATTNAVDAGADSAPAAGEVKTLFVREVRADCSGESPRKCLQVRESPTASWTLLYAPISGFTYEESYAYELKVAPERAANAPSDAPTKRWRLVEIVSKKKVAHPKK